MRFSSYRFPKQSSKVNVNGICKHIDHDDLLHNVAYEVFFGKTSITSAAQVSSDLCSRRYCPLVLTDRRLEEQPSQALRSWRGQLFESAA